MTEEKPCIILHTSSGISGSFSMDGETTYTGPERRRIPSGECGYHEEHEP